MMIWHIPLSQDYVTVELHRGTSCGSESQVDQGDYYWPRITQLSGFPAAASRACVDLGISASACNTKVANIQDIDLSTPMTPHDYLPLLCDASGFSLMESPGAMPTRNTRRAAVHKFFHEAGKRQAEAAGKAFNPPAPSDTKSALYKGFHRYSEIEAASKTSVRHKELLEHLIQRRQGKASGELSEKTFENALEGKIVQAVAQVIAPSPPPPPPPTPRSHGGVNTRCGGCPGCCDKYAYTVEGGGTASAGVALGVAAGVASGYSSGSGSGDRWGFEQSYGSICGGVSFGTDVASIGVSLAAGFMNNFASVAGYSETVSANGGIFFIDFGAGVINCCSDGWRGCSACGGFGSVGVSLAPDSASPFSGSVDYMQCHTLMFGSKPHCFFWKRGSSCPSCFPEDALVETPRGSLQMKDLRVGDKVLTSGEGGELKFEDVYFFGHADTDKVAEYVEIQLAEANKPLQISKKHFVPLCPVRGEVCEYADRVYKYAKEAMVGDHLWRAGKDGSVELGRVEEIGSILARGMYNPYTLGGSIIVNDMLASAHSNWILDDYTPESMTGYLPAIYQALFAPGRLLYSFAGAGAADFLDLNSPMTNDHGFGFEFLVGITVVQAAALFFLSKRFRQGA